MSAYNLAYHEDYVKYFYPNFFILAKANKKSSSITLEDFFLMF